MASHGVPRSRDSRANSEHGGQKELQNIQKYKDLVYSVTTEVRAQRFTHESLELISKLLMQNPEYYTVWNYRRLVMRHLFADSGLVPGFGLDETRSVEGITQLISNDLGFLFPLLRKFPKCYWIWNYRLWLLEQASSLLPADTSLQFWLRELSLVGKMLTLDSRNFLGWGYRRTVVAALESSPKKSTKEPPQSMAEQEFQYTTRMIEANLSNFSAWHSRSKLIPRLLNEQEADATARQEFLDSELELIQRALYADSNDQSLWFYHQFLICSLDPKYVDGSIAPNLSLDQRLEYIRKEYDKVLEMLVGAEECKWIYQALIQISTLYKSLSNEWPSAEVQIKNWIRELQRLDPLRKGRWHDMEKDLEVR